MRHLAMDGAANERVRRKAIPLFLTNRSCGAFVHNVNAWIQHHMTIVPEYGERIQTPERILEEIEKRGIFYGDCDDAVTLASALLLALGVTDQRFVAMRYGNMEYFEHVILEVLCGNGAWYRVDPTVDRRTFYSNVSERMEVYL